VSINRVAPGLTGYYFVRLPLRKRGAIYLQMDHPVSPESGETGWGFSGLLIAAYFGINPV
jgi:hypothetical protein